MTQAEFCDAEATLLSHCQIDAACAVVNLNNCGSVFAALNPAFVAAIVACIDKNHQSELAGFVSDGGALAQLASDFCKACGAGSATCAARFAPATVTAGDASLTCLDQFLVCEYLVLGASLPGDASKDGGL